MGAVLPTVSSHTAGQSFVWDVSDLGTGNGSFTLGLDSAFAGALTRRRPGAFRYPPEGWTFEMRPP